MGKHDERGRSMFYKKGFKARAKRKINKSGTDYCTIQGNGNVLHPCTNIVKNNIKKTLITFVYRDRRVDCRNGDEPETIHTHCRI